MRPLLEDGARCRYIWGVVYQHTILVASAAAKLRNSLSTRLEKFGYGAIVLNKAEEIISLLRQTTDTMAVVEVESLYPKDVDLLAMLDRDGRLTSRIWGMRTTRTPDYMLDHVRCDVLTLSDDLCVFTLDLSRRLMSRGCWPDRDKVSAGALDVLKSKGVASYQGSSITLSRVEADLLWVLVGAAGEAVERSILLQATAQDERPISWASVPQYIMRIKAKLAEISCLSEIQAVRRNGYRYVLRR